MAEGCQMVGMARTNYHGSVAGAWHAPVNWSRDWLR
jgi:hypothetical protein